MWAPQPNARLTTPSASLLDVGFNRAHISPQSSSSIPRTNKRNNGITILRVFHDNALQCPTCYHAVYEYNYLLKNTLALTGITTKVGPIRHRSPTHVTTPPTLIYVSNHCVVAGCPAKCMRCKTDLDGSNGKCLDQQCDIKFGLKAADSHCYSKTCLLLVCV